MNCSPITVPIDLSVGPLSASICLSDVAMLSAPRIQNMLKPRSASTDATRPVAGAAEILVVRC
jgi:hypothetical protein